MMLWLFPGFLLAASAVLVPLLLHLLRKRHKQPRPFPSLRFLGVMRVEQQRWHRIRRWLVLLLRCTAIALLAAAFARPFFPSTKEHASRATVIVIDNSFSMQAAGCWPALREWTLNLLSKTAPTESVGVLLMNPQPSWLVQPREGIQAAVDAVARFRPGWFGTQAMPALRFAGDTLAANASVERRIVMVTDRQACGWREADFTSRLPAGITLEFAPETPALRTQAALSSLTISREGDKLNVSVQAKAFETPVNRTIRLYAGNQMIAFATQTIQLGPNEVRSVTFQGLATVSEKWIRCELNPDDLTPDDLAYALLPETATSRVVLLDELPPDATTDYVATACESLSGITPAWKVGSTSLPSWPAGALLFLRNDSSFSGAAGRRVDAFLEAGGSAFIFSTGGPAQRQWLEKHRVVTPAGAEKLRLNNWVIDHPLVEPMAERNLRSLIGWQFSRAWSLAADTVEPLAFWDNGAPAFGELAVGKGRVLVAGFTADRRDGTWPIEASFLPFLHRSALYLLGAKERAPAALAEVGKPLQLPTDGGQWETLAGPATGHPKREVSGWVTPTAPGVYEWTSENESRRLFAVGLSLEESDPSVVKGAPWKSLVSAGGAPATIHREKSAAVAEEAESQQQLWWWCLAAAALCLLLELGIANRTTR